MLIRCPSCSTALSLPDNSRADRAKCKLCGSTIELPSRSAIDEISAAVATQRNIAQHVPNNAVESRLLISCSACGKKISKHAKRCPNCGHSIFLSLVSDKKYGKRLFWIFGIMIGLPVIFCIGGPIVIYLLPETQQRIADEKLYGSAEMASLAAKNIVKRHLRNPSTAEFPWFSSSSKRIGKIWNCHGLVKAKNSFGLELTYSYLATVSPTCDPEVLYCWSGEVVSLSEYNGP